MHQKFWKTLSISSKYPLHRIMEMFADRDLWELVNSTSCLEEQSCEQVSYEWKGNSSPGAVFVSLMRFLIRSFQRKGKWMSQDVKKNFARTSAQNRGWNKLVSLLTNPLGAFPLCRCVFRNSHLHYSSRLHYVTALSSYGFREGETLVHEKSLKEEFIMNEEKQ